MTTVVAHQKYIRTSARKLRLVADLVRGLPVGTALTQLSLSTKRAARTIMKVLTSAQKNAINTKNMQGDSLRIQAIVVDDGPSMKRFRPVSRGRAHPILKRSSHLKITLMGESTKTPSVKK